MAWSFGMPPPGFDELIAKKYAMEQQRTDASTNAANASANLDNVRAGLLPSESAATTAETNARTQGIDVTNRFLPSTLTANINDTIARTGLTNAQAANTIQTTKGLKQLQTPLSAFNLGFLQ